MAADIGDDFEKELEDVFRSLNASHLLAWHAFPDTKRSNGGAIATQPSDYLLGLPPGASCPGRGRGRDRQRMIFCEAKASEKHTTMKKASVRPGQRGFIQRWGRMLDLPYYLVFYSSVNGTMEIWRGDAVVTGARINKAHRALVIPGAGTGRKLDIEKVALQLVEFFDLPEKRKTVKLYERLTV